MFCCSLSFCNSVAVLFIFLLSHCHCSLFLLSHCSAVHFPSATVLHYCSFFLLDTTATFFLDSQTHCIVIQIQLYWSLKKCTEAWIKNILKSVSQNLHVKFVATSKEQESYKFLLLLPFWICVTALLLFFSCHLLQQTKLRGSKPCRLR